LKRLFPEQDRDAGVLRVVTFTRPDLEAITAVHPSLILTSTTVQRELAATLRAKGYRVQHLEPASRLSKSAKRWARPKMHPQWCEK
jgi:ABC-type Fe3+-hydroxamate transport system substrate-binding protein